MYIIRTEIINTKKSRILFDNGIECICCRPEIRKFDLEADKEITEDAYLELMKDYVGKRAKKKAMELLIRSDKTEKELRDKLKRECFPEFIIDETMAFLHSYHYINEDNHLETYIRYHGKGKSRIYLKQELKRKGFDREKIGYYLEEYHDEKEELRYLIKKKGADIGKMSPKEIEKLCMQLYRKGFSQSDIRKEIFHYPE
ncbi:regulatory protein [[Clostridium] polysaccharolyticum]|uniref:Regulatory protein RecX n=2 Tax=[Clostridium] polysaccharolyticum TaxID=29364 RepID=A0A1I0ADG2_9FIRM|nr:regulatory protein [[Clostridium] polysaccharolyticum]